MSRASEIVAMAKSQLGYKEKASNSNLDDNTANAGDANWTKYARDLAAAGYYNGNKNSFAWCDVFVDWVFFKCYGKSEGQRIQCQTGPYGAGCTYSMQYYQQQGRCDKTPKVGDQIFFRYSGSSGADHTGIVVDVTSSQIVTIEGNSGNMVKQNSYSRSYSCIIGYGHPLYSETDTQATSTAEEQKTETVVNTNTSGEITNGSIVAIKSSAERYTPNGALIPSWVKKDYYHVVTQVTSNGKSVTKGGKTCVLLGKKVSKNGNSTASGIMTWVAVDNLELVSAAAKTAAAAETVYTVVKGDTLWDIAKKYLGSGARYTEIVKLNGLKTSVINVGQKLKLPSK